MAGHSKWANIRHRKGAQDAKRAKIFTKIIRELTVAAKMGGDDIESNPRLRAAVNNARLANMPKDTMERAIKRGLGNEEGSNYEEIRYEGYGPGGTAFIVETLTENRNRTAGEIRAAFSKMGGNLGETGSVTYLFERKGMIQYPASAADVDTMFEAALEAGADHVESDAYIHEIHTSPDALNEVREALSARYGDPQTARLEWIAQNKITVDATQAATLIKLVETLEENDDVQHVSSNFDIPDEVMDQLQ
mgnify:CR=1 FL=1